VIIDISDSLFMLFGPVKCPVPYQHLGKLRVIDLKIDHFNRILYETVDTDVILGVNKNRRRDYFNEEYQLAMAIPISLGESSCIKWLPCTVTSSWLCQPRQNSLCCPVSIAPGSAFINNFGIELLSSHRE
tara:strand:+ start:297 stop:686 length:390 start_codon:yes stop_codon:yes gene_type:complete